MCARKKKITKNNFGCYTNAEQKCIAFLKDLGKLIQAHYTQHSGGLCSNESSNFSILSSRKKSVIIFTIPFFFSHLYNLDPCLILPKVLPRLPLITLWVPQTNEEMLPLEKPGCIFFPLQAVSFSNTFQT